MGSGGVGRCDASEHLVDGHLSACGGENFDGAVDRCGEGVLHLHRLDDDDDVTRRDLGTTHRGLPVSLILTTTVADLAARGVDTATVLDHIAASLRLAEPGEHVTLDDLAQRFDPTKLPTQPWILTEDEWT